MNMQAVEEYIEKNKGDLIGLLQKCIQSRPVNPLYAVDHGYDEAECEKILISRLQESGVEIYTFDVELDQLEEYRGMPGFITGYTDKINFKNRPNIVAKLPGTDPEHGKSILLIGHCDVVAADDIDRWKHHPFAAEIEDGVLYGRGCVDELGGLISQLIAIEAIIKTGNRPKGDIWFSSVVCEESGGTGVLAVADWLKRRGVQIDAGIMGEPTDLDVSLLCRNITWGDIIITGRTGHLEEWQPHWTQGGPVDAIKKARYIMDQIDYLNEEWEKRPDKNHPLEKLPCQVKVAMIKGGHHRSSYPAECELSFNIQILPQETDIFGLGPNVKEEFEEFIQKVSEADPWLKENPPVVNWVCEADCSEVSQDHPFVSVFEKNARKTHSTSKLIGSGFHTDTGWLMRVPKIPVVNYGPGNPALAHSTNERCKTEDVVTCCKTVAFTCLEWCNMDKK